METREYNKIKVVLADKRRNGKDLAEHLGVKPASVSRWCTNRSQPSIETLFLIAEYLGVKPGALLSEG